MAATPDPVVAADVTAEVALSPALNGRPAITTSSPRGPPALLPPAAAPEAPDPLPLADTINPVDGADSEGAEDESAAPTPPEIGAAAALVPALKPPNIGAAEPALLPLDPAPILTTASTPAVSCSVSPLLPDSITSLPLAALMLPGSTRPVDENTATPPLGASERMPELPARIPDSPAITTSPLEAL